MKKIIAAAFVCSAVPCALADEAVETAAMSGYVSKRRREASSL